MKKQVQHTSSALANVSPATPPPTMTTRKGSVLDMMHSGLLFGPVMCSCKNWIKEACGLCCA